MSFPIYNRQGKLTDKWLFNDYSECGSGLTIIGPRQLPWTYHEHPISELGIPGLQQCVASLRGKLYTSKRGTDCFQVQADGPHRLICALWHVHTGYYARPMERVEGMYFRRSAWNDGRGGGCVYVVIRADIPPVIRARKETSHAND